MKDFTQKLKTFLVKQREFLLSLLLLGLFGLFAHLIRPFEFLHSNLGVFITITGLVVFLYGFRDFHDLRLAKNPKTKRLRYLLDGVVIGLLFLFYMIFSIMVSGSLAFIMQSMAPLIELKDIETSRKSMFLFSVLLLLSYRYHSLKALNSKSREEKEKAEFFREVSQDFIVGTLFASLILPLFARKVPDFMGFDYFFNVPTVTFVVLLDFLNCRFPRRNQAGCPSKSLTKVKSQTQ